MSSEIKSFRDLIAWQKAIALCREIYAVSRGFPDAERFGLTSQIRRAAVSIPSNIAEGYGRNRTWDYVRFLDMARGSLHEVETQLVLATEFRFAPENELVRCESAVRELDKIINGLARAVGEGVRRGT